MMICGDTGSENEPQYYGLWRPKKTVSACAPALHLDCTRTYIGKLEAEGVIQRQGHGFPLDQCRVVYLRRERRL
jgi:hypothetical protein